MAAMLRLLPLPLRIFCLLIFAAESDAAVEFTKIVRRECAQNGNGGGGGSGGGSCGVAVRSDFADAGELEALRSLSAMTAERAETDAALSVYEFESNGITRGDGFATFRDRHKLRPEGKD